MRQIDFHLPSLGADMESATLTAWLKKPGDAVRRGEALATIETDKGLIDLEAYDDATMAEILVSPGTKISVGTLLARLTSATAGPEGAATPPVSPPLAVTAPAGAPAPTTTPAAAPVPRARISPAARRRAEEIGLSAAALEQIAGRTSGGVVHVEDVETFQTAAAAPASDARESMRAAIGHAMARAKREIPHYYLSLSLDFLPAQTWLNEFNAKVPVDERMVETALIAKAIALAAAHVEGFNGHFKNGRFEPAKAVHLGCAIAVRGGGLVAPALPDADSKDLKTLMRDLSALVTRVRSGHMRSGEFSSATLTLTSLGNEGVDALYPIINPPQVAIIGAGAIRPLPWVHEGTLCVRPVLTLTLAADHRVTDGRSGSRFLRAVADALEAPAAL